MWGAMWGWLVGKLQRIGEGFGHLTLVPSGKLYNIAGWNIPNFNRKYIDSIRGPHFPGIRYVSLPKGNGYPGFLCNQTIRAWLLIGWMELVDSQGILRSRLEDVWSAYVDVDDHPVTAREQLEV